MSGRLVYWAKRDVRCVGGLAKAILILLADEADDDGNCSRRISQVYLAGCLGVTERTVRRALHKLEDRGLLRREEVREEGGARANDLLTLVEVSP